MEETRTLTTEQLRSLLETVAQPMQLPLQDQLILLSNPQVLRLLGRY
jgi:hypothetical protein